MARGDDVRRILLGDASAFGSLVERHHGRLLRLARALVRDEAIAQEVVRDTWHAVLDGLASFDGPSSLLGWISRTLVSTVRSRRVSEGGSVPFLAPEEADPSASPGRFDEAGRWRRPPARWDAATPDGLPSSAETRAALEAAIARLPARQQAVLVLGDVNGLGAEETCAALEITEAEHHALLHRARVTVWAALEAHHSP